MYATGPIINRGSLKNIWKKQFNPINWSFEESLKKIIDELFEYDFRNVMKRNVDIMVWFLIFIIKKKFLNLFYQFI